MPRVAQSCALCGAPLVGKRWKYCEVCCPSGMRVRFCSACGDPFLLPVGRKKARKTCSDLCKSEAFRRAVSSPFDPFDCTRCGVHVASNGAVKGAKPHQGLRLCGPCKSTMSYAKSLGKTLAEYDASREVELNCAKCGATWTHIRSGPGRNPKRCERCAPCKDQRRKSSVGQPLECRRCGSQFVKRGDNQKYCSVKCADADGYERTTPVTTEPCEWCGKDVTGRRYKPSSRRFCGRKCQMAYKVCVTDGMPTKPWPRTQPCVACGEQYPTKSKYANARCPTCRPEPQPPRSLRFVAGRCRRCDEPFVIDRHQYMAFGYYCSDKCGTRDARDRRNARKRAAYVADVWRPKIYRRDGYCCQICGGRLAMDKKAPHPKSPTIDHIVPISRGGTHEPANCQAAHFLCNSRKSNGTAPGGDQLLLIG